MSTTPTTTGEPSTSRRLYRGLVFAVMVGVVGAAISAVPALFIQSIFVGEAQRCIEAQRKDIAISGVIETNCAEGVAEAPVWLPVGLIAAGGAVGLVGGFGYGFVRPPNRAGAAKPSEAWLPF